MDNKYTLVVNGQKLICDKKLDTLLWLAKGIMSMNWTIIIKKN